MPMESRLKILKGVRGNSHAISSQQGEKERDLEYTVPPPAGIFFFFLYKNRVFF